jgi:heptosyltransferase-2
MKVLILKLNATGDVVRTTPLLHRFGPHVTWVTDPMNAVMLTHMDVPVRCIAWNQRAVLAGEHFDLLVNLEDDLEVAEFASTFQVDRQFGACLGADGAVTYTEDAREWFDLSLISTHGRRRADELKLFNRRSYQDLIFEGLGYRFQDDLYLLPRSEESGLYGDVAIAPVAGPVWPMKNWAYYGQLQARLEAAGLKVNVLPRRPTMLKHIADVRNHRCLVSGDSLPMHIALGAGVRCVTLFSCTSPWEIHGYGLQKKIVSPLLEEFFYKRGMDSRATTAIEVDEVFDAVMASLHESSRVVATE